MTLIQADAGYGKTILLHDFSKAAPAEVAWYTLDSGDRELPRFARYLVEAVRRLFPSFAGQFSSTELDSPLFEDPRSLACHLVEELRQLVDRSLVIVLDNYEKVNDSQEVASFVSSMIEFLPRNAHLFLGSRERPAIPLGRLRAELELVELDKEDLSFSLDEARDLLVGLHGLPLGDPEVELLVRQTEGWVAGLVMSAQAIQRLAAGNPDVQRKQLHLATRSICEYFSEEVFRNQDPEIQTFLQHTSVLTLLHVDVCNALLGHAEAGERLTRLEDQGCFISSVDGTQTCFRYHPLFRDFLLHRLKSSVAGRDAVGVLHQKAARALEECGRFAEAHEQYLLAGELESAADIVERVADDYIERGQLQVVRDWLSAIPERVVSGRPWLMSFYGKVLRRSGDNASAIHLLRQARQLFVEQGDQQGLVWVTYEMTISEYLLGQYGVGVRIAEDMLLKVGDDPVARARLHTTLCHNSTDLDELATAEQHGEIALKELGEVPRGRRTGLLSSRACRYLARVRMRQGMLQLALHTIERAMELCQVERLASIERSWVQCTRGAILVLRGDKEMALEALQAAVDLGGRNRYTLWQSICLSRGNAFRDFGDYDQAEESYRQAGDSALIEMAFLRLCQERTREAVALAQEAYRFYENRESPGDQAISRAMLGIVEKARGLLDPARVHLEAAVGVLQRKGLEQWLASIQLHLAHLELNEGNVGRAVKHLKAGMDIASRLDLRHFLWWEPSSFYYLLGQALQYGIQVHQVSEIVRFELKVGHAAQLFPLLKFPDAAVQDYVGHILEGVLAHVEDDDGAAQKAVEELFDGRMDEVLRKRISGYVARGVLPVDKLVQLRKRYGLTWREIDVFCAYYLHTGAGQIPQNIGRQYYARQLCMAENTFKVHVANIRRKLGLAERGNVAFRGGGWVVSSPLEVV